MCRTRMIPEKARGSHAYTQRISVCRYKTVGQSCPDQIKCFRCVIKNYSIRNTTKGGEQKVVVTTRKKLALKLQFRVRIVGF